MQVYFENIDSEWFAMVDDGSGADPVKFGEGHIFFEDCQTAYFANKDQIGK